MELISIWWVWVVVAVGLGVLEVLLPSFIFLGFAIAAVIMAVIVGISGGMGPALAILIFAVLALVAWLLLRAKFGTSEKDVKVWRDDINKN
jgi:inner membrane protein